MITPSATPVVLRSDQGLASVSDPRHSGWLLLHPAVDKDPFLARLRATPEFAGVRAAGIACQNAFLAERRSAGE
jgi:hypothetical protein